MVWRIDAPQGNEADKCKWDIVPYTAGRGLDLGCGQFKAFDHFIGVDNGHHWGAKGVDVMVDTCEKLSIFADSSMDFVFSSHLLEHIEDTEAALKEWMRVIKNDGYLILYLPHKDYYPNVGQEGANPDHKHDFLPEDIIRHMKKNGAWDLVVNEERNEGNEYSFFQVYKKGGQGRRYSYKNPRPEKTAAVIRYGAFGDAIQTSSVLAALKAEGYHVTFYTTDIGQAMTKHDPNIDEFVVQGKDQIPNHLLGDYWEYLAKKYTKLVNLSESVERTLLSIPQTMMHSWPQSLRHKYMNVNYLEFMHDIAELEYVPRQRFYATDEEKAWALAEKKKMGGNVVFWSLSGSSVHKVWPWLDHIIAKLLLNDPTTKIVLTGDHLCQLLEAGWENEPRVFAKSGKWTIRQSIAFAQVSDLVIGPETGVLNAVAFDEVPKIITLSHSSVENLSRDWVNTTSLTPKNTPCYPCHKMHYSFEHCVRDDATGVAACQADITIDQMWEAIKHWSKNWQLLAA
jgi:ADP-heptose:LPS heptosyltransferase/predicted SAM-dependent methyltransferase